MLISDLNRFDTLKATVDYAAKNGGIYLKINDLEDTSIVKAYNCYAKKNERVLVSIQKIDIDNNYISVKIDSVIYEDRYVA